MARLILAVATGNMVANLPPLFEVADPVHDRVLWLESERAKKGRWVDAVLPLCAARGFADGHHREPIPEAIHEMIPAVLKLVEQYGEGREIYLIGNGGTKLHFGGLLSAIQTFQPRILYSEGGYTWQCFTHDWQSPEKRHFERAHITLEEVLACRNSLQNSGELIWDARWDEVQRNKLIARICAYGEEEGQTVAMHDAASSYAAAQKSIDHTDLPAFQAFAQTDAAAKWLRSLTNFMFAAKNISLLSLPKVASPAFKALESLYQSTLKQSVIAEKMLAQSKVDTDSIGPQFEIAVAKRVVSYLNRHHEHACTRISQVYLNAKIFSKKNLATAKAETDVLLVTQSGTLLHLECKSFQASQKDLDARIANLHETGSDLARMSVVMPIYTTYAERDWFDVPFKLYQRLEPTRLQPLPFTMPGQPETIQRDQQNISIPTFEMNLAKLLEMPY